MTNRYFDFPASLARFLRRTLARAEDINARLDDVSAGFDAVQIDVDGKVSKAGDTMTGALNLVAPPSLGTSTAQAATTAWVQQLIATASTLLPLQSGQAKKVLQTDGSQVSWVQPLALGYGAHQYVSSGSYQCVYGDGFVTIGHPDAGVWVRLPDATQLRVGTCVAVAFGSVTTRAQGVSDGSDELLYSTASSLPFALFVLRSNSTVGGLWRVHEFGATGPLSRDLQSVTQVDGVAYTFETNMGDTLQLGSDLYLQAAASTTGAQIRAYLVTINGMEASRGAVASTSESSSVVWCRLLPVSGGYVFLYLTTTTGDLRGCAITVSGDTVSIGAATAVMTGVSVVDVAHVDAISDGSVAVCTLRSSTTVISVVAVDITGTTLNVGTPATAYAGTNITYPNARLVSVASGKMMWVGSITDNSSSTLRASVLTLTGLSIAVGSQQSVSRDAGVAAPVMVSDTAVLIAHYNATQSTARIATVSGTTITFQTATNISGAGSTFASAVWLSGSTYVAASGGTMNVLNVSGNTVTQGANASIASAAVRLAVDGPYVVAGVKLVTATSSSVAEVSGIFGIAAVPSGTSQRVMWRMADKRLVCMPRSSSVGTRVIKYGGVA